jgi:hypothetical protein
MLLQYFRLDSTEEKTIVQRQVRRDVIVAGIHRASESILGRARLRQ